MRSFLPCLFLTFATLIIFTPTPVSAQVDDCDPTEISRFDLNRDGKVGPLDVDLFNALISAHGGALGRGTWMDMVPETEHLDFDGDGFITLADVILLLEHFGHFTENDDFEFVNPNGCQLGDFNTDTYIDEADMGEFLKGLAYWQWWNLHVRLPHEPIKPSIYSFGDVDMNGVIDEVDFGYIRLLWTDGVEDFDKRYPNFPDAYTSEEEPCSPWSVLFWLLMM